MLIITGSHEESTGKKDKEGNKIIQTVIDRVTIPDEPRSLSDFPKGTIAPGGISKPGKDGTVVVVTVDGHKFRGVKPGSRDSGTATREPESRTPNIEPRGSAKE